MGSDADIVNRFRMASSFFQSNNYTLKPSNNGFRITNNDTKKYCYCSCLDEVFGIMSFVSSCCKAKNEEDLK